MSLTKLLVVNRGEIARRIFRAARTYGVRTVAVYAEPDATAPWTVEADERYPLPGSSAADTYLNQPLLLEIARRCGADAIHPGYGFLSENSGFARACRQAGLTFVGPGAEAIRLMGSKALARRIAVDAGVPLIPGVDGAGQSQADLMAAAAEIGFPVLVKASAGGGGKGMRVVRSAPALEDALQAARSEALSSFGDDHLLLEKYFTDIRHIEVQVLGDQHGNVIHLFERECSIQRRHQKIIEESPAPRLGAALRQRICEAAVALARAVNYSSAGTVEFILTPDDRFYLLEMNTRLQVEHPITELVTGVDLALWQLRIAAGERLTVRQADLVQRGHALECRVYAEDPARGFMPSTGELRLFRPPAGPGVRVDAGVATGAMVTPYFDPLLAKIITWGADRQEALRKMDAALADTIILGVTSNIPFLRAILAEPHFVAGETPTHYLERHFAGWQPADAADEEAWLAAAAFEALPAAGGRGGAARETVATPNPWTTTARWRNVAS
jgi:acetyl-CoA carboxylase biotin carboxylase subunit